ncbi:transporter substrate-binding domain-containing protein [Aestuariirhabdus sp. Z084]|uniref:transporter substrate-binding domain-containing protein n=1 Tax=Aestuariirhabdus haliotis TaxID=2918751 RepID=UPI00201B4462|nr:transporter substrate-binding domain-containing protein [Aestuariirhabdus haliotis]MCL6416479.1 transporter substrate-binding domain-containing protein [Aestuariirhabdus haliotis]MCL6420469.1 transporter substrate-binding domain-containing protein [Aestuariirhabdus haliotis]
MDGTGLLLAKQGEGQLVPILSWKKRYLGVDVRRALLLLLGGLLAPLLNAAPLELQLNAYHLPPFAYDPQRSDQHQGFMVELIALAGRELGWKIEPRYLPFERSTRAFGRGEGDLHVAVIPSDRAELDLLQEKWACADSLMTLRVYRYDNLEFVTEDESQTPGADLLVAGPLRDLVLPRVEPSTDVQVVNETFRLSKMFWYERARSAIIAGLTMEDFFSATPPDFDYQRTLLFQEQVKLCMNRSLINVEGKLKRFMSAWKRLYRDRDQEPVRSILQYYQVESYWWLDELHR